MRSRQLLAMGLIVLGTIPNKKIYKQNELVLGYERLAPPDLRFVPAKLLDSKGRLKELYHCRRLGLSAALTA